MPVRSRQTHIGAEREVVVTEQLENFLEQVQDVSLKTLESPRSIEVDSEDSDASRVRKVNAARIYPAGTLHFVHFERWAQTSAGAQKRLFDAAYSRMTDERWDPPGPRQAPVRTKTIPNPLTQLLVEAHARLDLDVGDDIKVTASSVQQVPREDTYPGFEYALMFDESPATKELEVMSRDIYEVMLKFHAGKLVAGAYVAPLMGVPFARLPITASNAERRNWVRGVHKKIPPRALTLRLLDIGWDTQLKSRDR